MAVAGCWSGGGERGTARSGELSGLIALGSRQMRGGGAATATRCIRCGCACSEPSIRTRCRLRASLAGSLSQRHKCADAARIEHEVLGVQGRVLSAEGPSTPMSAVNLASSLPRQGKYTEAEAIENEVLLGDKA